MEETIKWDHTYQALMDYAEMVKQSYRDNLKAQGHVSTGKLMNTLNYSIELDEARIEVTLELEDYWKYVEYDTKPHFPPYKAILDWVKVKFKGNLPNTYDGKLPSVETLEKRFAYFTQKKIGEHGTTGTHSLQSAVDGANAHFESMLDAAIGQDVNESLNAILLTAFGNQ